MRLLRYLFLGLLVSFLYALTPVRVVRVIDGDTYKVLYQGKEWSVRLIGIDCPESRKNRKAYRDAERTGGDIHTIIALGRAAKEFVKKYIKPGETVYLEFDVQQVDRYGRLLAYVWLDSNKTRMMNEILVREGYAQVYTFPPNVKYQERFLAAQRYAREHNKGLWGGISVVPKTTSKKKDSMEPYYVGNRRSKVFHRPSCSSVTRMSTKNKVIFHSREEALKAGYRPCRRCNP